MTLDQLEFSVRGDMATLTQLTLIIACAYLADSRFLRKLPKHQTNGHQDHQASVKTNLRDADAVVFPTDHHSDIRDDIRDRDESKINEDINVKNHDTHGQLVNDDRNKTDVANIVMPLISKIIPDVEVKDIFTNPIPEKMVKNKNINDTKPVVNNFDVEVKHGVINEKQTITENVATANINNTVASSHETVPDLSSRFGGTSNYMLVPVAANVQNYQPIQSSPNGIPISNEQGNIATQTYGTPTEFNTNNQQFIPSTIGPNVHHTAPNGITNVGTTLQAPTNIGQVQFPANNMNFAQGTNTFVPVNVPNTYVINGQLYAAVTVPYNGNVPSALYYVNPQVYQVANNKVKAPNTGGVEFGSHYRGIRKYAF